MVDYIPSDWPAGDGEMAERVRRLDWSQTPLGASADWPTSLRVATRLLLNTRHPMFIWWGRELTQIYNDAYRDTMGSERHPAALGQAGAETWAEIWDVIGPQITDVMAGGPATWHEDQLVPVTRHGELQAVWWTYSFSPIDEASAPKGVGGVMVICRDVTAEHLAKEAAVASARRLQEFGEASTDVLWIRDAETLNWTYLTPAFETIYGMPRDEALAGNNYSNWLDLIVPEDRDRARSIIGRVVDGERITFEYRVQRPRDGAIRWLRNTDFPIHDAEGRVVAIGGVGHDATREKQIEETLRTSEAELQLMVGELQHRTRNLIGVVGTIMRQVVASSASLADFRGRFTERLEALSRVQGLFSRKGDETIGMGDVVRLELDALGADLSSDRVRIEGDAVALRKSAVQTLSLALHELATNAVKYGALYADRGSLVVRWNEYSDETGKQRLQLVWTETGIETEIEETLGPMREGGYGRRLIEEALPYTLKAKTTYALGRNRLDCTIDMPLDR
ncbi:sensor histidine kinase [Aureimonas leprariae]|uniref:sensor histidine kinase n=1 Tax=Plantimonas leprariae TaxID=2615207 RepID=UPI001386A591|nr:HWE histidine kinase domain-containing protein [Aureimonas leprariae]